MKDDGSLRHSADLLIYRDAAAQGRRACMQWLLEADDFGKSPLVVSHVEHQGQAPIDCHQLSPSAPKTGEQVRMRAVRWRWPPRAEKMVLCVALQAVGCM